MTRGSITVDELRHRLGAGEPVTVLDIRSEDEYADWHVPGSTNVPAYDALAAGAPSALEEFEPADLPVVTVCGRGAMAAEATRVLRARGVDARTLEGGLQAWSTAWNTAQMTLETGTEILQVRRVGKGCLSYIVASEGEAAVVDPALAPEVFTSLAKERGWTIEAVLETHLHADHVSRAKPLAEATGARLLVPENEPADFDHEPLADADETAFGSAALEVIEVPGHTPGSAAYLVDGEALLTGDTLFLDAVGRPDLEAQGREERRARALHASLERLLDLPDGTRVLPGHADRPLPFDGEVHGARLGDLPGRIGLLGLDEDAFAAALLERLPETPPNHETIVDHNREARWPDGDLAELEAGANRCAAG